MNPTEPQPVTKVIFRKYPKSDDGEVIAIFPEHPESVVNYYICSMYVHDGGHCSGDPWIVMRATRPATLEEYAPIKRELESAPYFYRLKVYQRQTPEMRAAREREWRRIMSPALAVQTQPEEA